MRIEAEARTERDDTSDAELDEDGAEPSASDSARLDGRPPAARRHRPADQDAAPPADPMAVDRPAGGPAGGGVDEATTDDEHVRAQPTPHALAAPSSVEASGAPPPPHDSGGAPTPMAVDLVEPPGAAAMRASDEMQQTTIGGGSDAGGSDRPRRKKKARRGPRLLRKQRERAQAMQAAAQETDGRRADVVASGGDGNDGD